ncbi:phospho-N-acetylmuramoyl-pentapeptide-transferase [Hydrogenimonas cancrithermarum]|uniref:Phospho-N-acetylmuramoyl-pentapeptide-transferase n=1 Tax=Hydrogenimonas cancrithermarum TaxID=2993563 RepID=A0ABN6WV00_9BACT|nr:phospho-N-acetylmuramoyl-pentapeptide-transferase [Hydrogenimonas cancrithermarum]BDY12691.1 phospho-N-acetylmuramoyl-pentapeptide-transferase [Hydrogenimonas cancrithermarum]
MLYWFYRHLDINLFQYITVRAGFAFFIAFVFTIYLMPLFISWAKTKKASQPINKFVPKAHLKKSNTPTMGGVVFIFSTVVATLLSANLSNLYIIGGLMTLVGFCALGLGDDLGKVVSGNNLKGLTARAKFAIQLLLGLGIGAFLLGIIGFNTEFYVPFVKFPLFDMQWGAVLFWALVIVAASNAVNLTDGLDGLATVPSVFALFSLGVIVYVTGNAVLSHYLLWPKVIGVGEVAVVASALIGALIGFLWYNCNPAEVFMGDSGSLAVGAFLGYMAILGKSEILLILIGAIFVIETVSVIAQIGSYKLRGKRIFLMAPIHHHFEMKQWAENKIIVRFWIIAFIANLLALITLKIR